MAEAIILNDLEYLAWAEGLCECNVNREKAELRIHKTEKVGCEPYASQLYG